MIETLFWLVVTLLMLAVGFGLFLNWKTRGIARNAEHLVPPIGHFVEIDGERVHYIERGEGPAILLIHGLGGHLHHMRPIIEHFGSGYRLIALDRPGSGYSSRRSDATGRLSEQAVFIARFIDALELGRPLIVGHSLGGAIALSTALSHPEKVAGLALIAPLTGGYREVPPEFRPLHIPSPLRRWLVSNTIAVPMSLRNAPRTLAFVFGPQQPPADFAIEGGALAGLRPSHIYATSTDLVALGHDLEALYGRYGEIRVPTAILFGAADRVLDHRVHGLGMEGRIEGIEIEILDGIGHMPQYAARDRVIAFVRRMANRSFEVLASRSGSA